MLFRSRATGNWNASSIWEISTDGGTTYTASAGQTPTSSSGAITIQNGHNVTVSASVNADELTVNSGGTITVSSGQTLTIDDGTGTDLTNNGTLTVSGTIASAGLANNGGTANINGTLQINQGGFYGGVGTYTYSSTGTLVFNNSSGSYGVNNDAYWPATNGPANVNVLGGGITLNVARTCSGTVQTSSGIQGANNLTIGSGGVFQVNTGGFVSGSPTYGANATLRYNTGGTYGRNGEWLPGATSGSGYPYNVRLSNSTGLNLPNGSTSQAFQMAGDLTIDSGSRLDMAGSSPLTAALSVLGNVTNSGTLALSTSLGGDLHLRGSLANGGTFTHNNRAVYFEGTATQNVSDSVNISGGVFTLTIPYVRIDKTAGTVRMLTALNALGPAGGDSIQFANATSTLTLNGQKLTLGSTVGAAPSGAGLVGDTTGSHLDLEDGGTAGDMGAVAFVGGSQQLTTLTVNRTGAGGSVTFGSPLLVNAALNLTSGVVRMGANTLSVGTFASRARSGGYIVGAEQKSFANTSSFTFDVGTADGYTPVEANSTVATGTGSISVKPTASKHPNVTGSNALARYWTLAGSNVTTNLTFHYLAADVAGAESSYKIFRYTGGAFTQFEPTALDTTNHTATLNGVSSFSDWTLAEADSVFGTLKLGSATYSTAEGDSGAHDVTITVTRAGGSAGAVSVQYATADGTATAGSDYTAASGTLNWADGDASARTVNVSVSGDSIYEGDESFSFTISSPAGATLGTPSTATVTVIDDEAAPTLSVGDVTVAEPSSGITYAVFPVTLAGATALTTTVNYATADGTATAPGDYAAADGTVTFAPGETSKTVAVIVKADAIGEPSETFTLNLSSPTNAAVADGQGVATITAPVGAGTILISEFRLRGPGDPNAAPIDMDQPVLLSPPARKGGRRVMDSDESDATPTATPVVVGGGTGGDTNAPPAPPETDEFIELYNNSDADIVVTDANPVTCALQVINAGPATACGWALVDLQGSASGSIPRFVIPTGTVIPARGHFLAASTGYSLGALATPDLTYNPPAYSGGEADYTGLALFKTADRSQFTQANVFDAVGFEGVAAPFREGSGLLPASGVSEDLQYSFVRNQTASRPSDTGDNLADFTLVCTTPSLLTSGTATLGAPAPENSTGVVSKNSGFNVSFPPGVASSLRSDTTVSNGSLGTLSLRRRFTNNTGQTISKLRFRVVQLTTYNSKQIFSNQADVRLLDAQLAGLSGTGLKATNVETPPAQTSGGGVNTGLVVSGSLALAQPLAAGQSVDVEFLLGVMKSGSFQFVVVVEGAQ